MPHPHEDDLALLARGARVDDVCSHVRSCPTCEHELLALTATVDPAHDADPTDLPPPPPAVWERICGELGLAGPAPVVAPPRRRLCATPERRTLLVGGAALLAAAAGAVALVTLPFGGDRPPVPAPEVAAPLSALGRADASGRVVVDGDGPTHSVVVDTTGLPDADGSYEVWLLDLEQGRTVALGALDDSGRGRLAVPEGVRLGDYPEVDVSLEPDDGDPAHSGDSVLRAQLPA